MTFACALRSSISSIWTEIVKCIREQFLHGLPSALRFVVNSVIVSRLVRNIGKNYNSVTYIRFFLKCSYKEGAVRRDIRRS